MVSSKQANPADATVGHTGWPDWNEEYGDGVEVATDASEEFSAIYARSKHGEHVRDGDVPDYPTITSLSPSAGPVGGGTVVTVTGTLLTGATALTFGGTAGTSRTVNSATSITVTSPAHSAGAVDVVVTTPGGTGTRTGGFTYAAAPTVPGALSPATGVAAGNTTVTITGTNLTGTSSVTFGGTAGTSLTVVSATSVTVHTPAHATGAVDVVLTAPGGSVTKTGGYTYT